MKIKWPPRADGRYEPSFLPVGCGVTIAASLVRILPVGPLRELGPGVHNRFVVSPDDLRRQSPFILLVEDFIAPQGDYHMHPHRGLATVTLILDGHLAHRDHSGTAGVVGPGDVQWMTAGRGIFHGGRPEGNATVHALQLWLNLPAARKAADPITREQRKITAALHEAPGVEVRRYGASTQQDDATRWSEWPMTLTHIALQAGVEYQLLLGPAERSLLYVLKGTVTVGTDKRQVDAGHVGWIDSAPDGMRIDINAAAPSEIIAYASVPIDEPLVVHGPFAMNYDSEIVEAYRDLQADRFISRA